jgi:hypothetical protein
MRSYYQIIYNIIRTSRSGLSVVSRVVNMVMNHLGQWYARNLMTDFIINVGMR